MSDLQPVEWPIPTAEHAAALERVVNSGRWTRGAETSCLEQEFARFTGADYAVATGSGTSGLEAALCAAEVGPGDEVIVPSFTFSACAHAVVNLRATPVFADVDPRTFNLTPDGVANAWSNATRAVMVVHLHGVPADATEIVELALEREAMVVEDACQAIGARHSSGDHVGLAGAAAVFSLNATKSTPGGEGGVVVTNAACVAERVRSYVTFGELEDAGRRSYLVKNRGGPVRLNEFAAAVARIELAKLPGRLVEMRRNEVLLRAAVESSGLTPPAALPGDFPAWHKYRVRISKGVLKGLPEIPGVPTARWMDRPLGRMSYFSAKGRTAGDANAAAVLDQSFLIGDERHPLIAQPRSVVEDWCRRIIEASQAPPW